MASRRYEMGVGCLLLVAMAATAFMAIKIGAIGAIGRDRVHVTVPLTDAAGLGDGATVAVAGVKVGEVEHLRVNGALAEATIVLDPAAQVRTDVRVRIRARSLLGEKYLEFAPQSDTAPLLADGDTLPAVGPQIEIDELVQTLAPLVESVDPEALAKAIRALSDAIEQDPERMSRMLANADVFLANASSASADLPALMSEGRGTLASARTALNSVDARARQAEGVLTNADLAITDVRTATTDLPELVGEVRTAVGTTQSFVARLDANGDDISLILDNLSELDKAELHAMLQQDGIFIRLFPKKKAKSAPE